MEKDITGITEENSMENNESKYRIGDHVVSAQFGKAATVQDVLYSNKLDEWMYLIRFDDSAVDYARPMPEDDLGPECAPEYRFVVEVEGDRVNAAMYKSDGIEEREVSRGTGWLKGTDDASYAQAASYAMRWVWNKAVSTEVPY